MTVSDKPCSCGDPYCPWNAAGEVLAELGWYRPSRRPIAGAEPLSKPWTAAEHQARLAAEPKETP